jgi:precorrin-4/cobalt-precorrin-4 C11-methyltransferase
MALFLSVLHIKKIVDQLTPFYGSDCPVAVVQKATWPEQKIVTGTLVDIAQKVKDARISSTAIIFVGRVLDCHDFPDSRLYAPDFSHRHRRATLPPKPADTSTSTSAEQPE